MGFESPEEQQRDFREQSIDSVKEGTSLPTSEGMADPEIAKAFLERLSEMTPEELDEFSQELEATIDKFTERVLHKKLNVRSSNIDTTDLLVALGIASPTLVGGNSLLTIGAIASSALYVLIQAVNYDIVDNRKNPAFQRMLESVTALEMAVNQATEDRS